MSPLRKDATNPTSFLVEADHWYDFAAARGGDVIDLAAELDHDSNVGAAVRALAEELGIKNDDENYQAWKEQT